MLLCLFLPILQGGCLFFLLFLELFHLNSPRMGLFDFFDKKNKAFSFSEAPPESFELPPSLVCQGNYVFLKDPAKLDLPQFRMRAIPAGEFRMGSEDFNYAKPIHSVKLNSFYMAEFAVTEELWQAVMGQRKARFEGLNRPSVNVSWFEVVEFCNKLNELLGLPKPYAGSQEKGYQWQRSSLAFRLPTEAEWEYAASAGENHTFAGSARRRSVAWTDENNNNSTVPAGFKFPNAWDLYDMSGNVWEWIWDVFDAEAYSKRAGNTAVNPLVIDGNGGRVLRGGSWGNDAGDARVALRDGNHPDGAWHNGGFRLVLAP